MAPTRPLKRQKTDPDTPSQPPAELKPEQIPLPPDAPAPQPPPQPQADEPPNAIPNSRLSWYQSWSRKAGKAAPVTSLARESSNSLREAAAETASVLSDRTTPRRPSTRSASLAMTLGKSTPTRPLPVDATTSKVHATSDNPSPSRKGSTQTDLPNASGPASSENKLQDAPVIKPAAAQEDVPKFAGTTEQQPTDPASETKQSGWFGWIGKGDNGAETPTKSGDHRETRKAETSHPPVGADNAPKTIVTKEASKQPVQAPDDDGTPLPSTPAGSNQKRTWLQMLGGDSTTKLALPTDQTESANTPKEDSQTKTGNVDIPQTQTSTKSAGPSQASSIETSPPPPLPGNANKSAGWVFWSRERNQRPKTPANDGQQPPHEGEIAISDTPSQSKPKRASISLPEDSRPDVKSVKDKEAPRAGSIKSTERPQTPDPTKHGKEKEPKVTSKISSKNAAAVAVESDPARPASPAPSKREVDNLLLPTFHDTLHVHQNPTLLQQLARLLYYTKEPEPKHLSLVKDPPRIRNALAIGVHGYFPGPMVRTLLGQPTGTSIKFADMAAKSIRKWTNSHGYDCEVKTAALEGEGKIGERVELLWKLLLNWIDEIRRADFVMIACHSQGVPVAVMLVAKLIQFGCISAARVGICAMAGVSMGPFAEFKSRWISGSAGELFEFSDPSSKVSSDYQAAMETVLKSGVRLTMIGSIDDQLVSLESSIFAPITHPHIYRAVLINSRIHAPGFLSHLVGFVLKLRNLGVQDHGLIRELSSPLAGSLYTGEGHSRIYEDEAVYDMAVSFALETTAQLGVDVTRRNTQSSSGNPYILPFAMRGILEEDFVRSELREEANQLLRQFDEWRPNTKALKDVKFRLEGVRSKL